MEKIKQFLGIDISKNTFDVYHPKSGHAQFENNHKGFGAFAKTLDQISHCVMETTGSYHYQLAVFLYNHEFAVSVVNPLVIKRFIQMKLQRTKTDKSDARMIYQYGVEQMVEPWEPEPYYIEVCKMLQSATESYFKQSTALKNKIHSLSSKGITQGILIRSLKRQVLRLKKEIKSLEGEIEKLIKQHDQQLYTNLSMIPGIGRKTALLLISTTNGFRSFETSGQLSAYFGLAPTERSSGISIKGRSRISKAGNPRIRNYLFMCSFTACKKNPQCKALFDRIVAKGKSKKLALIAVANKLIKQTFAVAKSGIPYDSNYRSVLTIV